MIRRLPRPESGAPYPLGATWDGEAVNFALFSEHATRVELCLFSAGTQREVARVDLLERTDNVWHGRVPVRPGALYGYRVHGPYAPNAGHRFNANKLLIDPYARQLDGRLRWSSALFGYRAESARDDLSFDRRDSAFAVPKCVVVDPAHTWGDDRRPAHPWPDTLIYEAHLRGATMLAEDVAANDKGRCLGFASDAMIEHLLSLGVTAVEFLPVQAFIDDRFLVERGLVNFWGYNTIGFFAPDPRYLGPGGKTDFQAMVRRLHSAGIEVILDVVYNHTGEGNHLGPTVCFRGIDNHSYYRLDQESPRYYVDDTGCGNMLDFTHPRVIQLAMDSLRYWVETMHVDGFRFDLATTLGREAHGFDPGAGFFDAVRQDPVLNRVKLIAEPWDLGPGGYQLGGFPSGFAEWNDRFRDCVRRLWRGEDGMLPEFGARLLASADLFDRAGRKPWTSLNFVAAHDGMTLADLAAYESKHNEANGEANRDGADANHGRNFGVEGPTGDPAIRAARAQHLRNLLATLFLAQGTPMLRGGDEIGDTQDGNNNAYCQDNPIGWLDWTRAATEDGQSLLGFVRRISAFRRRHPVLRQAGFLHAAARPSDGLPDAAWFAEDGTPPTEAMWHDPRRRSVAVVLRGVGDLPAAPDCDDALLIVVNAGDAALSQVLPPGRPGQGWRRAIDTSIPDGGEPDGGAADPAVAAAGARLAVAPRSILVLTEAPAIASNPPAAQRQQEAGP